ncbi:MAG: c-type cytochrome [Bacteroidia bacterium]
MKIKLYVISFSILFIWIIMSFTQRDSLTASAVSTSDSLQSQLYAFGAYIYKREKCGNCHSLNISNSESKVSLDGLIGKYSLIWHYNHLLDPASMVHKSEMPAFAYLSGRTFKKDTFEKYLNKLTSQDWNNIISEGEAIRTKLEEYGLNSKSNSELIALIYYLDNIPQSEAFKLIRSKELEKAKREMAIKDSIWSKPEVHLADVLSDPKVRVEGHLVFRKNCSICHGNKGEGVVGPNLTDEYWLHGSSDSNLVQTIVNGVPDKGMKSWKFELSPVR